MKATLLLACLFLTLPVGVLHGQQLCAQCLSAAGKELDTCLESAISREDKVSCEEKHAARAAACKQGECLLEQAAQSGNKKPVPPETLAGEKSLGEEDRPRP